MPEALMSEVLIPETAMTHRRWPWLLFLLCGVAVLYGIFRQEPLPVSIRHFDKELHIIAFLSLGLTARYALSRLSGWWLWPPLLVSALLLEYLQSVLAPLRQYSLEDGLANIIGVLAALIVWRLLRWLRKWLRK